MNSPKSAKPAENTLKTKDTNIRLTESNSE